MRRIIAVAGMLALLARPSAASTAGTVQGAGILFANPQLCAPLFGPAPATLSMHRIGEGTWQAAFTLAGLWCGPFGAAACGGVGTLATGVRFRCLPEAFTGELEPITLCFPGPIGEPAVVHTTGYLHLEAAFGSAAGDVDLLLAGEAITEAGNSCV